MYTQLRNCGTPYIAGGFNTEEDAARAHDVMAMKCRGTASITNYSQDDYMSLYPRLQKLSKVQSLSCCCRRTPLAQGMRYLTSWLISLSSVTSFSVLLQAVVLHARKHCCDASAVDCG